MLSSHSGTRRRLIAAIAAVLSLGLLASACGGDDGGSGDGGGSGGDGGGSANKTITIGWIPWDEDIAATHLWKKALEDQGYTVELQQLDAGPLYAGMAGGDIDVFLDGWLPVTHQDYWEQYQDDLEDIGVWYDNAKLTIAVPADAPVDSLADLPSYAGDVDGKIVGIEQGAGLTRVTQDEVIPQYNLDSDYELVTGSTPAMLAELDRATSNGNPVVVTLWRPHWAYSAYDIKDLEDPKGALGEAEEIHTIARAGFGEDFPEVTTWLENFTMTDAQLGSLEELVINEYGEGKEAQAVDEWVSQNQEYFDQLTSS